MRTLKSLAKTKGLLEEWELIVTPWLKFVDPSIVMASYTSEKPVEVTCSNDELTAEDHVMFD